MFIGCQNNHITNVSACKCSHRVKGICATMTQEIKWYKSVSINVATSSLRLGTLASNVDMHSQAWPPKCNPCCVAFCVTTNWILLSSWFVSVCLLVLLITHGHTDYESIVCNLIDPFSQLGECLKTFHLSSCFFTIPPSLVWQPCAINLAHCGLFRHIVYTDSCDDGNWLALK